MMLGTGIRTTPVVIVPSDLAEAVPTLRSAWAGRDVRVIVEDTERGAHANGTLEVELPWDLPRLPRALRSIRPRLRYVLAIEPPPATHADRLAAAAMARLRDGDRTAIGDVFATWFDPAHAYLKVSLAEPRLASQTAQAAFMVLLAEPSRFDPAGERFGAFFVELLHEVAAREGLVDPAAGVPALGPRPRGGTDGRLAAVSDVDLLVFLQRIAPLERRVLVLRWILGFERDEVAEALELDPVAVAGHEHAGIAALQRRIEAHGRCDHPRETRASMDSLLHDSPVVRARRRALVGLGA